MDVETYDIVEKSFLMVFINFAFKYYFFMRFNWYFLTIFLQKSKFQYSHKDTDEFELISGKPIFIKNSYITMKSKTETNWFWQTTSINLPYETKFHFCMYLFNNIKYVLSTDVEDPVSLTFCEIHSYEIKGEMNLSAFESNKILTQRFLRNS